ncbi:FUSC family protein [Actinomadura darangshiensis]|uniref:FUSC family protein n=1 Tax=Actinomadura darangshiensis TaxID=705336 RepID=UPI00140C2650|nr:FUSC family protein [Actinomadura darangshiensis]
MRTHLRPFAGRRYWEQRAKLTVKAVLAAVVAWLIAKYGVGHAQPYFAPLAALLGVYPTVVRSLRESLAYAAGFVIGAGLAIPVGLLIGPNALGIAVVVVLAMLASGWRRLGEQASQVAFTALFALLVGGHQVVDYTLPRLADVTVGLVVGLAVNAAVFPPLYLRRGEYAVREMQRAVEDALGTLAEHIIEPGEWDARLEEHESRLAVVQDQARYSLEQGEASMRANPRAKLWGYRPLARDGPGQWPARREMNTLDHATAYIRSIAATLRQTADAEEELSPALEFRHAYAALLRALAGLVRRLPETPDGEALAEAERIQRELEEPHLGSRTDAPGLWDPEKEMLRLSRLLLDGIRTPGP